MHYNLNIDTFTNQSNKQGKMKITYVCSTKDISLSSEFCRNINRSKRKDIKICSNESDLLTKFVEDLENYNIDLISSYGLSTFDGPLLCDRMKNFNIPTWWKLGRLKRKNPKGSKITFLTVSAGRIPIDLRVMCNELIHSKNTDFSAVVYDKLKQERQNIDNFDLVSQLTDPSSLENIINYNARDAIFVSRLLENIQILPLTHQISKLSGCPWERVLLGQATHRCEHLLLHEFSSRNYVLPEKLDMKINNMKKEAKYKGGMVLDPLRGFYDSCILVLDFNSLYPSIIREFNICFTTVDRDHPDAIKSKAQITGVLPSIMEFLVEERKKVKKDIANANKELNKENVTKSSKEN